MEHIGGRFPLPLAGKVNSGTQGVHSRDRRKVVENGGTGGKGASDRLSFEKKENVRRKEKDLTISHSGKE